VLIQDLATFVVAGMSMQVFRAYRKSIDLDAEIQGWVFELHSLNN
jgi:hypothetical protein